MQHSAREGGRGHEGREEPQTTPKSFVEDMKRLESLAKARKPAMKGEPTNADRMMYMSQHGPVVEDVSAPCVSG